MNDADLTPDDIAATGESIGDDGLILKLELAELDLMVGGFSAGFSPPPELIAP